jgi:crotonobetainyl-CoA:carnitine CoA-transferase CaiB-like acyl-CoA transferase
MALAGGISAALFHRERTGQGSVVDISLLSAGLWAMQASFYGANVTGRKMLPRANRKAALSPTSNNYATKDGRRIALSMIQSDRYWADLCRLVGREDLATDPRFADLQARAENNVACIAELDAIFAQRTFEEWCALLGRQEGQWAPVNVASDANHDPQVLANGYISEVDYGDGRSTRFVTAPVQFDEEAVRSAPSPALGQHTEEVLLELGIDWSELAELKDDGAIS